MANYHAIKAAVNAYIKRNGRKEITGTILNSVLNATIDSLGRFFQFAGMASPSVDPGTPDQNVCYLAGEPGVYTYFGGITLGNEEIALLFWDGEWTKQGVLIGIQEVNASVDNQSGTPSVDVGYTEGVLTLTFHNLKGDPGTPGTPGAAAGFGTVGADVDGNIGTPGVTVQTSGPDTAKNLMFHFTNLKGETGVTSVVATVENTSGTPSCQVSLVGQQLTLAFSGLKGLKGDTGVSADYPITIYNGLDSDATDAALAAAQGKVLQGEITQLEAKVDDINAKFVDISSLALVDKAYVLTTGTWTTSTGRNGSFIDVIPGDKLRILAGEHKCRYCLLTEEPATVIGGQTPPYVEGTTVNSIEVNTSEVVYIPNGCTCLQVNRFYDGVDYSPQSIAFLDVLIPELQNDVEDLTERVDDIDNSLDSVSEQLEDVGQEVIGISSLVIKENVLNISDYSIRNYSIQDNGNYNTVLRYKHITIPCDVGYVFRITANNSYSARYAWLTSQAVPVSGAAAPIVPGTELTYIDKGNAADVAAPTGATYLYIYLGDSNDSYPQTPASISRIISKVNEIEALKTEADELVKTLRFTRFAQSDLPIRNYSILTSGMYGESTTYKHTILAVGETARFFKVTSNPSNAARIAFLSSNAVPVAGGPIPVVNGTAVETIAVGETKIFTIPTGATYIAVYSGSNSTNYFPSYIGMHQSSAPTILKTITVGMELGTISVSSGEDVCKVSEEIQYNYINSRLRSSCFVNINDGDTIVSVGGLLNGEILEYFCYDSNFNYIGYSASLLPGTGWVKLRISLGDTIVTHGVSLTLYKDGPVKFAKNDGPVYSDAGIHLLFEVGVPTMPDNIDGNTFTASSVRTADTGFLLLPRGYNREGTPTPLVLWCHGTGGHLFGSNSMDYSGILSFMAKNGFAVADCSGITALYGAQWSPQYISGLEDSKNNPLLIACYKGLLDHIGEKYNIDTKSIYILTKSAGGLIGTQLGYVLGNRVRAIAHFAPALCMVGQSWRVTGDIPLKFWLERFGIDTSGYDGLTISEKEELWLSNLDKVFGYDPLFSGTGIDYQVATERMFTHEYTSAAQLGEDYGDDTVLMAMFDSASKTQPFPMKIWHAPDDNVVPILWSQKYVQMARRGGYICALRTMPVGTGGHHCMDSSPNAPTTSYLNKDGETTTIQTAVAEAIEWFKRW